MLDKEAPGRQPAAVWRNKNFTGKFRLSVALQLRYVFAETRFPNIFENMTNRNFLHILKWQSIEMS